MVFSRRWLAAGGALAAAAALGGGRAQMTEAESLEIVAGLDGGAPPLEIGDADTGKEKKSVGEVVQAVLQDIKAAISKLIEKVNTAERCHTFLCLSLTPQHAGVSPSTKQLSALTLTERPNRSISDFRFSLTALRVRSAGISRNRTFVPKIKV